MYTNPGDSLNLLNPNATATISLQGLMLFCFDRKRRCQIGVLRCDDHDFKIDIFSVPRTATDELSARLPVKHDKSSDETRPPGKFSLDEDILILADNPLEHGILSYKNFSSQFDRRNNSPAPYEINDFRWIINLESEEFHNRKLEFIPSGKLDCRDLIEELCKKHKVDLSRFLPSKKTTSNKGLKPKIIINAGTVYTQAISSEKLLRRDEEGRLIMLGKVAYRIGIDIKCDKLTIGNGRFIEKNDDPVFTEDTKLELEHRKELLHVIQIANTCSLKPSSENPESTAGRSDLDLFYDVIRDPVINHRRYDLQGCINPGTPDNPAQDGFPDICIGGYLGDSDDLGSGR